MIFHEFSEDVRTALGLRHVSHFPHLRTCDLWVPWRGVDHLVICGSVWYQYLLDPLYFFWALSCSNPIQQPRFSLMFMDFTCLRCLRCLRLRHRGREGRDDRHGLLLEQGRDGSGAVGRHSLQPRGHQWATSWFIVHHLEMMVIVLKLLCFFVFFFL